MRFVMRKIMMLLCFVAMLVLVGYVVERLWNWLMPTIFGLRLLTYWQAFGLLVLSKILFGGIHKHGGRGGRGRWKERQDWKRGMKERWGHMTPEEKEKFRAGMKARFACRFGGHRDSVDFDGRFGPDEPVREKGTV